MLCALVTVIQTCALPIYLLAPLEPRRGPGLQRPFLAVRMDDAGARQDIINLVMVDCVDADRGADVQRALAEFEAARRGHRIADPPRGRHTDRPMRRGCPPPRPRSRTSGV